VCLFLRCGRGFGGAAGDHEYGAEDQHSGAYLAFIGRRVLLSDVATPANEHEVGVVGPPTAQQLRSLCESEDVFAAQIEDVRNYLPKNPEAKRH
jgi:hypothetical protein